ncbi:MAG: hypothetical protein C4297_08640 [Gemmataceae bacterium]
MPVLSAAGAPPAYTASQRARWLHLPGRQVLKGVLVQGIHGPLLAVLPATQIIELESLGFFCGEVLHLADPLAVAQRFRDCEFGVVPAFGSLYGLPTYLDADLDPACEVALPGPTHFHSVVMMLEDYERLERPVRAAFACEREAFTLRSA